MGGSSGTFEHVLKHRSMVAPPASPQPLCRVPSMRGNLNWSQEVASEYDVKLIIDATYGAPSLVTATFVQRK